MNAWRHGTRWTLGHDSMTDKMVGRKVYLKSWYIGEVDQTKRYDFYLRVGIMFHKDCPKKLLYSEPVY